jgi:hypothetical protein
MEIDHESSQILRRETKRWWGGKPKAAESRVKAIAVT